MQVKLDGEAVAIIYGYVNLKDLSNAMSSNAFDGWGAVVNEAIEEGMRVYGTYEAGSSATILPNSNLFHVNDWKSLRNMLGQSGERVDKGIWSVANAARNLVQIVDEVQYGI